jgi:hypothetical protein
MVHPHRRQRNVQLIAGLSIETGNHLARDHGPRSIVLG